MRRRYAHRRATEHELFIAARNAHVLAFDNLSAVAPGWLSDALVPSLDGGRGSGHASCTADDEESRDQR